MHKKKTNMSLKSVPTLKHFLNNYQDLFLDGAQKYGNNFVDDIEELCNFENDKLNNLVEFFSPTGTRAKETKLSKEESTEPPKILGVNKDIFILMTIITVLVVILILIMYGKTK